MLKWIIDLKGVPHACLCSHRAVIPPANHVSNQPGIITLTRWFGQQSLYNIHYHIVIIITLLRIFLSSTHTTPLTLTPSTLYPHSVPTCPNAATKAVIFSPWNLLSRPGISLFMVPKAGNSAGKSNPLKHTISVSSLYPQNHHRTTLMIQDYHN